MKIKPIKAQYRVPEEIEFRDNPLICALPPLVDLERFDQLMEYNPPYPEYFDSIESGMIAIGRLRELIVPNAQYRDVYQQFYRQIVQSYNARNPMQMDQAGFTYEIGDPTISIEELNEKYGVDPCTFDVSIPGSLISGLSGVGKTRLVRRILSRMFPSVIIHNRSDFDDFQIVYLIVELPNSGDQRALLENILLAIDDALESLQEPQYRGKLEGIKEIDLLRMVQCAFSKYHVGMLVVDEIQNIIVARADKRKAVRQLFGQLTNLIKSVVVVIGTRDVLDEFNVFTIARRIGIPIDFSPYSIETSKSEEKSELESKLIALNWNKLLSKVTSYQVTHSKCVVDKTMNQYLLTLSCGITYCLVELWIEAQITALRLGHECVDTDILKETYDKRLQLMKPALDSLRTNNMKLFTSLVDAQYKFASGNFILGLKIIRAMMREGQVRGQAAADLLDVVHKYRPKMVGTSQDMKYVQTTIDKLSQLSRPPRSKGKPSKEAE